MPPTFQVLANTLHTPRWNKDQKWNAMKYEHTWVLKCKVVQVTCIQVYPSAHSRVSSPRFHPLSSKPQRQIHGHAGVGGAAACLSLALSGWSRTRTAYMLYASTLLTETRETSSYNLQVYVCSSLVSPFCSLPCCSTDERSPTCLIVACRSIHGRPCTPNMAKCCMLYN